MCVWASPQMWRVAEPAVQSSGVGLDRLGWVPSTGGPWQPVALSAALSSSGLQGPYSTFLRGFCSIFSLVPGTWRELRKEKWMGLGDGGWALELRGRTVQGSPSSLVTGWIECAWEVGVAGWGAGLGQWRCQMGM